MWVQKVVLGPGDDDGLMILSIVGQSSLRRDIPDDDDDSDDHNDNTLHCNVDKRWQRRPHGMALLKTNTTKQISLSYTVKYISYTVKYL